MLRHESCQDNLKVLPESMFNPMEEKNWKQLFNCGTRKDHRVYLKKLKKSYSLHLWNDHSSLLDIMDIQQKVSDMCPIISLAEDHCPMIYHREIKKELPTQVKLILSIESFSNVSLTETNIFCPRNEDDSQLEIKQAGRR